MLFNVFIAVVIGSHSCSQHEDIVIDPAFIGQEVLFLWVNRFDFSYPDMDVGFICKKTAQGESN